jgi:hypothetical protein
MDTKHTGLALFDLERDRAELRDLAAEQPEVVQKLQALAERACADLGDSAQGVVGSGKRPHGTL